MEMKGNMLDASVPVPPADGYVLCGPIFLAKSRIECWRCKQQTSVVAVIATRVDEYERGDVVVGDAEEYVYGMAEDEMPEPLRVALEAATPHFKPVFSGSLGETTWANTCEHCDSLQGAFYQHSEPDGPFFGEPAEFLGDRLLLLQGSLVVDYDSSPGA